MNLHEIREPGVGFGRAAIITGSAEEMQALASLLGEDVHIVPADDQRGSLVAIIGSIAAAILEARDALGEGNAVKADRALRSASVLALAGLDSVGEIDPDDLLDDSDDDDIRFDSEDAFGPHGEFQRGEIAIDNRPPHDTFCGNCAHYKSCGKVLRIHPRDRGCRRDDFAPGFEPRLETPNEKLERLAAEFKHDTGLTSPDFMRTGFEEQKAANRVEYVKWMRLDGAE